MADGIILAKLNMGDRYFTTLVGAFILCTALGSANDSRLVQFKKTLQLAKKKNLANSPEWLKLLHWSSRRGKEHGQSIIRDPRFFQSPKGCTDASAELTAIVAALIVEAPERRNACYRRFPARAHWLAEKLQLALPERPPLTKDDALLDEDKYESASLVFASGFMNSAPSMFGHVILVISGPRARGPSRLAIHFAGGTAQRQVRFSEAVRGVLGLLDGYYTHDYYYDRIRRYRHLDQRDIWEYKLVFTSCEVRQIIRHYRELRNVSTPYSYLTHNCAHGLLRLIDVARSDLRLADRAGIGLSPLDVVKLAHDTRLTREVRYEPCLHTAYNHCRRTLGPKALCTIAELVAGNRPELDDFIQNVPIPERQPMLDAAHARLSFMFHARKLSAETFRQRVAVLNDFASALGLSLKATSIKAPVAPPHTAHPPFLVEGGVVSRDKTPFYYVGFRLGMHDLMDPLGGYPAWSEITVLHVRCETPTNERSLVGIRLQQLTLLELRSYTPVDDLAAPFSWTTSVGWYRDWDADGDEYPLVGQFSLQVGRTKVINRWQIVYLMGGIEGQYAQTDGDVPPVRLSLEGGLLLNSSLLALHIPVRAAWNVIRNVGFRWSGSLDAKMRFARRISIHAEGGYGEVGGKCHGFAAVGMEILF